MFSSKLRRLGLVGGVVMVAAATALLWVVTASGGAAGNLPSDKATALGSQAEQMGPGQSVSLLGPFQMRTSNPEDLVLQVSAECEIDTALTTTGNDTASSQGQVQVWVEVDGKKVPVDPNPSTNPPNPGPGASDAQSKVTFCNRAYQRTTSGVDQTQTIDDSINERAANAFNWAAINVGSGVHTIEVKADLTQTATNGTAQATVGNRTLMVQPTTQVQTPQSP